MRYGKKTNRFGFNSSQLNMKNHNEKTCITEKYIIKSTFYFYMAALLISMFFFTGSASAQSGYIVQPGRIDINILPRKSYEGKLSVHNFDPNNAVKIDFKVIELTQNSNGDWLPFDTDPNSQFDYYPGLDLSSVSSCRTWIKLDKTSVTINPDDDEIINVRINAPYYTKSGFYGATIMASNTAPTSSTDKVPMVIRAGIPVVCNVQLRPNIAPVVQIEDVGMEFVEANGPVPGKVLLTMKVKNTGTIFPRLKPVIRLRGFINGHWQLITTHEFNEIGIIPGKELNLKSDIGRSLPSAKYQLDAVLYVDQKLQGRGTRFGKEIKFQGDPLMTRPASDVPLDIDPQEIIFEMSPGLRRFENLKIHGAVTEKIKIQPIFDVPAAFKGKIDKNVKVEDAFTCIKWLSIEPKELTLEDYLTRNFSITAQMPEGAVNFPNYYAALGLKVVYPDGQDAGTKWINICVENKNAKPEPEIICSAINFVETTKTSSEYIIQSGFKNIGNTHIVPTKVRVAVVKAEGFGYTSAMLNTDKAGMFLPYETRNYSGFLDFSGVPADDYNLEVLMDYPPEQKVRKQIRISVREVDGRKIPEIISTDVKSDELVNVQWY